MAADTEKINSEVQKTVEEQTEEFLELEETTEANLLYLMLRHISEILYISKHLNLNFTKGLLK